MREKNVQNALCEKKMIKNGQNVQNKIDLFLTYFNVFENLRGKCVEKMSRNRSQKPQ